MHRVLNWLLNTKKGVITTFVFVLVIIVLLGTYRVRTAPDNVHAVLTPAGTPCIVVEN